MPHTRVSSKKTSEDIHAALRRDYAWSALLITVGLAMIIFALEASRVAPAYFLAAIAIETVCFFGIALHAFPSMRNRIADRVRSESPDSYRRRQLVRVRCYVAYVVSSIVFFGAQYAKIFGIGEYPVILAGSFTIAAVTLLWPSYVREKVRRM